MTKSEHLEYLIEWADRWLALPEADLPCSLTHEKCRQTQRQAIHDLQDHAIENGRFNTNGQVRAYDNDNI